MKLDDFDSVFRSAVKERFRFASPTAESALLVTDLPARDAEAVESKVKSFLSTIDGQAMQWRTVTGEEYSTVGRVLEIVLETAPDLIVSYRHLKRESKDIRNTLGSFVNTMTQATEVPVLLLPAPAHPDFDQRMTPPNRVLVVTDHLTGDNRLTNWGVHLCSDRGKLFLAHVEDSGTYERYMEVIGMIPDLDTETTTERIREKLLGRPADYIATIVEVLAENGIEEEVIPIVTMGHALDDYKKMVDEHEIDLLVLNSKDEHQLAMHGMGYAISVEFQDRPMMLL